MKSELLLWVERNAQAIATWAFWKRLGGYDPDITLDEEREVISASRYAIQVKTITGTVAYVSVDKVVAIEVDAMERQF